MFVLVGEQSAKAKLDDLNVVKDEQEDDDNDEKQSLGDGHWGDLAQAKRGELDTMVYSATYKGQSMKAEEAIQLEDVLRDDRNNVTRIFLCGIHIGEGALLHIAEALEHKSNKVMYLNLGQNDIDVDGIYHLAEALMSQPQ
jgi:hypothetical protein